MSGRLIVMGSGGAGLIAALHAAKRGADVTVLESAPVFGGTTALSGGGQWVPLNRLGAEQFGLQDSRAEVLEYLQALTFGLVATETLNGFLDASPRYVEFLIANTPCDIHAADIPDYYRGQPGSKDPGRSIIVGLYDTNRLGEYKQRLRVPPWPGSVGPITSNEERDAGWEADRKLFDLGHERIAQGIAARGRALVGGLLEACLASNVRLVNNARVVSTTTRNGRVVEVNAQRDGNGGLESFPTDLGLVLASGGFEWNQKLWDGIIGVPLDGRLSPPYNLGDGLKIASTAGARLANMSQVWWNPSHAIPGETYDAQPRMRGGSLRSRPGSIAVNTQGRRFFNENLPYNDAGRPIVHFDPHTYRFVNHPAWSVLDEESIQREPPLRRDFSTPVNESWLISAPTLRVLAGKIGVDPDGLEAEVKAWNESCEAGVDTRFHRGEKEYDLTRDAWDVVRRKAEPSAGYKNGLLRPLKRAPFYATRLLSVCYGTKGGPAIDGGARVLNYDDQPISGLFAAGNVAAGIFGPAYPGGGATLGAAMTMGWAAGESATS